MRAAMWTADDLAVVTDTEEEMQKRWLGWQIGMESKGLKVNTGKTEVMVSSSRGTKSNIKDSRGTSLRHVKIQIFMCHHKWRRRVRGSIRVSAAWAKWRDLSGVISDKKMPQKIIALHDCRPVLLYGAECWTVRKKKTNMSMLRRIKGVKQRDKIKSMDIRNELGVNTSKWKLEKLHYAGMDTCRKWKKTMKWEQLLIWQCQ